MGTYLSFFPTVVIIGKFSINPQEVRSEKLEVRVGSCRKMELRFSFLSSKLSLLGNRIPINGARERT